MPFDQSWNYPGTAEQLANLELLIDDLRHPERFGDFVWRFDDCDMCALGRAVVIGVLPSTPLMMADCCLGIPYNAAWDIFYNGCDVPEDVDITPGFIADLLENFLLYGDPKLPTYNEMELCNV